MKDANFKNSEGIRFFNAGKYKEAIQSFLQAINAYSQDKIGDSLYYDINLNLANSYQMYGEYDKAKNLYEQLLKNDPGRTSRYKVEFDNLMLRIEDKKFLEGLSMDSPKNNSPIEVSGDLRLYTLAKEILPNFPGIKFSIIVKFIEAKDNNKEFLRKLGSTGDFVPISQGSRGSKGHVLIYNREFWHDANDSELRGNLAHELMHEEWKDTGLDTKFFAWTSNSLNYSCLEWIIDLCVMAKGLAEDLYNSKKYICEHQGDKENYLKNDISMNINHLYNILERAEKFQMPGREDTISKYSIPGSIKNNHPK